jgi:multimeric flavodoxin WrbA
MAIPAPIRAFIEQQIEAAPRRYDDLRAVIFNGTLERPPEPSHTDGLHAIVLSIFEQLGVETVQVRTADHEIPPGVWPDMRDQGYETDDFPAIYRDAVAPADIILVAGPIWLGDQSSQTRKIIERLYAYSAEVNSAGQWSYYGKVRGALTTGNEDGGDHVSAQILYALQHIGLAIPPSVMPIGTEKPGPGRRISTPKAAAPRTPGRHATRSSWPGTCCTSRGCSKMPAAFPPTGTPPTTGTSPSQPIPTPSSVSADQPRPVIRTEEIHRSRRHGPSLPCPRHPPVEGDTGRSLHRGSTRLRCEMEGDGRCSTSPGRERPARHPAGAMEPRTTETPGPDRDQPYRAGSARAALARLRSGA